MASNSTNNIKLIQTSNPEDENLTCTTPQKEIVEKESSIFHEDPLQRVSFRYSAGIMGLARRPLGDSFEWVLLSVLENSRRPTINKGKRSPVKVKMSHFAAGKRSVEDSYTPLETALREFHEETRFLFSQFNLREEVINSIKSELFYFYPTARMYIFFAEVEYNSDIQSKFESAVKTESLNPNSSEQIGLEWMSIPDLKSTEPFKFPELSGKKISPSMLFSSILGSLDFRVQLQKFISNKLTIPLELVNLLQSVSIDTK